MFGRAVVLLQPDHLRAGEVLLEPQDVADLGAAPAIDRLVVIAHAADVAMRLRQQPQPQVLGDVGILVFVDQDIAEPALVLVQHVAVRLEDRDDMQKKVAEVGGIQRAQPLLIGGVKLGPAVVVGRRFRRWHLFRRPGAVLPGVDQPGQLARGPAFFVDVGGGYQLLEQTDLVVGIQNREVRLQPRQLGVAA